MLDIETLGAAPDGALIQVGAVVFNLPSGTQYDHFSESVEPEGKIDASTVDFWIQHPDLYQRIREAFPGNTAQVLMRLAAWWKWRDLEGVWTNAPLFDFAILRHHYARVGIPCPWHYRQERCSRTIFWLAAQHGPLNLPERSGTHHSAVDDASYQAQVLAYLLSVIRGGER